MRVDRRTFLKITGAGSASLALAACGTTAQEPAAEEEPAEEEPAADAEPVAVRTAALKGPTAMGLVRFMSEVDAGNLADNDYTFEIYAAPDEITPLIAKEGVDIAAVPANLAATLYNKTEGGVRVIAINTLGVLYICELGDTVGSVEDLRGKTIYASGKGSTPEYGLQYVLEKNGLAVGEDVTIEWKSEHAECVQALATAEGEAVAMLPQPFVTTAQAQNDKIRVRGPCLLADERSHVLVQPCLPRKLPVVGSNKSRVVLPWRAEHDRARQLCQNRFFDSAPGHGGLDKCQALPEAGLEEVEALHVLELHCARHVHLCGIVLVRRL